MEPPSYQDPGLTYTEFCDWLYSPFAGDQFNNPPAIQSTGCRFSGCTIRAELHEIQRPQFGRRFGAVDRRVLDDPPVVLLRLYRVYNSGTDREWSVELNDYDDIALSGLICMVELFEVVPDPVALPSSISHGAQHMFNTNPNCTSPGRSVAATLTAEQKFAGDVLVEANAQTVSEESNRTQSLFGTKFVEPHKIAFAGDGRKYILFTFNDLGVKLEGCFILRYRFFDLFSEPAGGTSPKIQAECYGGAFRIYSTKEAPALKESTVLTMCLAKHGVRANVRTKARKSRKKSDFDTTQTADL